MNRVIFLIDGFNVYHSAIDAYYLLKLRVKWLNIHSLCSSLLPLISKDATLVDIYYFSAFAFHKNDPDVIKRHENYINALKSTGIVPEMGRFKPKDITCPLRGKFIKHEEKETDIAIASRLFEILHSDKCDTVVLVTGDTDLTPAVETCNSLFPVKSILFAFPYHRYNEELKLLAPPSFRIHAKSYVRHQFPDPIPLPDGTTISKPSTW